MLDIISAIFIFLRLSLFSSFQGNISAADIKSIVKELGENFSDREIQEMIDDEAEIVRPCLVMENWLVFQAYFLKSFKI